MKKDLKNIAKKYKAFCDDNRLQILEILKIGEYCACELLEKLQISQSTLSHHMKILSDAGVVVGRKEGKWMYYSLNKEGIKQARELLSEYIVEEDITTREQTCRSCN